MKKKNKDFYQSIRKDIQDWLKSEEGKKNKFSEYLMFAPDLFHLLCKLSLDKRVPVEEKAKLVAAITYFASPLDMIPEGIVGPAGYVDDVALAAYVVNGVVNKTDPEVVREHWAGDEDVLEVIKAIIKIADQMVGSGLWEKLKKLIE